MTGDQGEVGGFDPGAPFVPDTEAGGVDEAPPAEPILAAPSVTEAQVVAALTFATAKANDVAGEKIRANLTMSRTEAKLIAPGVCKYVNARPAIARMVASSGGDEYLRALVGAGLYGFRITSERAKALKADAELAATETAFVADEAPIMYGPAGEEA